MNSVYQFVLLWVVLFIPYFINFCLQRRQWHPTPVLLPGKSHGRRAWWAAVHGVAKSQTRLRDFTFTFHFHALEKAMATHSSVLAWRIPGTGEPGGLPSMGSRRVGHDWSDLAAAASHASKGMLKILQARPQQYVNYELPGVQAEFSKSKGARDQIANIRWIMEKAREFQKNICC